MARGQTSIQFQLHDPAFGISQCTNDLITIQPWSIGFNGQITLLPVPLYGVSDATGQYTFTNLFGSPISGFYHFNIAVSNTSQRVVGNFWVQSTNLGTLAEGTVDLVNGAPQYPPGTWAWSAQASDARYAQGTNTFNLGNVTNVVTSLAFTNQLAPGTGITFVTNHFVVTISSTGGTGNGNYNSNSVLFAADIYATNGATIHGNGGAVTNLPANQQGYTIATNPPTASSLTNLVAFTSAGELAIAAQSLPFYDAIGAAQAASNGMSVANGPISAFVNTNRFDINNAGAQAYQGASNYLNTALNTATNASSILNAVTNTQNNVTFGNLNLTPWLITAQAFGSSALVLSNSSGGILVYIRTNASGLSLFALTNVNIVCTNIISSGAITVSGNVASSGQVSAGSSGFQTSGNVTAGGSGLFSGLLTSAHNTLDDGSGNVTSSGNITAGGNVTWQSGSGVGQLNGGGITVGSAGNVAITGSGDFQGNGAGLTGIPISGVSTLTSSLNNTTNYAGYVVTNGIASNTLSIATNYIEIVTNYFSVASGNSGARSTNAFLQASTTRNDGSLVTNLITAPSAGGSNFVVELPNGTLTPFPLTSLPSGGGSSTANAFLTNNSGAFPNVTAPSSLVLFSNITAISNITAQTFVLTNGPFIGTYQASNVNIGESGFPFLSIQQGASRNGHFVFGSTNNSLGSDPNINDNGVGIIGGNSNKITDPAAAHMVYEYIVGGFNNLIDSQGSATPNETNNMIIGSVNSSMLPFILTSKSMANNLILNSQLSQILNGSAALNVVGNTLFHASNSIIQGNQLDIIGALAIGNNITITNSDVTAINAGQVAVNSSTNSQILLTAANGIVENGLVVSTNNVINNQLNFGGNPYQTLSAAVLGVTNFSANLSTANGTYLQVSSTLWYDTNSQNLGFVMTILTNGAACLIQSNGITVATAGSSINGTYTITAPGSGNAPGVYIGSVIDETGVYHTGQGVFQSVRATNINDSYGAFPASTNVATLTVVGPSTSHALRLPINTSTNPISTANATLSFLNGTWTYNPNFTVSGDVGGYTNQFNQVYFFDENTIGGWVLASNGPPDLVGLGNIWWYTSGDGPIVASNSFTIQSATGNPPVVFATTNYQIFAVFNGSSQWSQSNTVWCDPINGNDMNVQRGQIAFPSKTLGAAEIISSNNDTIILAPGTTSDGINLKNGQSLIGSGIGSSVVGSTISVSGGTNINIGNLSSKTITIGNAVTNMTISSVRAIGVADSLFIQAPYHNLNVYNSFFGSAWDTWADFSSDSNSTANLYQCDWIGNLNQDGTVGVSSGSETIVLGQGTVKFYGGAVSSSANGSGAQFDIFCTPSALGTNGNAEFHNMDFQVLNAGSGGSYLETNVFGTRIKFLGGTFNNTTVLDQSNHTSFAGIYVGAFQGNAAGLTNILGVNGFVMTNIVGAITGTNAIRYTVPAGVTNSYTLEGYMTVTALSLDVIQPKIVWTDENGTVQTVSLGSSISGTGYNNLPYTFIKAKGGTVIFETNALTTGTGSITYNTEVHLAGVSSNQ